MWFHLEQTRGKIPFRYLSGQLSKEGVMKSSTLKFNKVVWVALLLFFPLFYTSDALALPPYCSDVCNADSYCNTSCTGDNGQTLTCYQWGSCDLRSLIQTSIKINKAYPYAFPDPYGFGLRMEYEITLGKGHEAVSVTTQYSADGGTSWVTDEENRPPTYNWDNLHGNIECGLAQYNLESNQTYTLRAILNYRDSWGTVYHSPSNLVTATVENYNPPVLYNNTGHIPESVRVNWRNAGLLPSTRSGFTPETPAAADVRIDVTSLPGYVPGMPMDAQVTEVLNRARQNWRDHRQTSIIYFPPGTYRITSPIVLGPGDSNIIFQGAGAKGTNQTLIECNVGPNGNCFDIYGSPQSSAHSLRSRSGSQDILKGDRVIVTSVLPQCPEGTNGDNCFAAGDWIHFWEDNFPAESGAVVGQITQLESVSTGFRMKDDASKDYLLSRNLMVQKFQPVSNIGIENLKIYRVDSPKSTENQYGSGINIKFTHAVNCWVRGVESELTTRHHILISRSSHIEISGCYLHRALFYGGNSYGYGTVLGESTTNCLVENNLFRRVRHAMGIGTGANANVYTFNYSREQHSTYHVKYIGDIVYADSDICLHGRYPYANLFEHNIIEFIEADNEHGANGPYNAFFRNRVYENNINLDNAPNSAVLGCSTKSSTALEKSGSTSFSIQAYGKSWLTSGKMMAYENAPWISYSGNSFVYRPSDPDYGFLKDISYYYPFRPYFLPASYTWPALGPEYENPLAEEQGGRLYRKLSQTIPAEGRYKSGNETFMLDLMELRPSPSSKDGLK